MHILRSRTHVIEDDDAGSNSAKAVGAYIKGETTTWTDLKLAGFHGTSQVRLGPAFFETDQYRYGVDGHWIPSPVGSSRTDEWQEDVPLRTALADRSAVGGQINVNFTRG